MKLSIILSSIKKLSRICRLILLKQFKKHSLPAFKAASKVLLREDTEKIAAKPIRLGIWIIAIFVFGFGLWGSLAPIRSAAIAPGKLVIDFKRKTIQHLEGGIIEEIRVKEGQEVVTGEPLIILRDISAKSQDSLITKQLITAMAVERRLLAERDHLKELSFLGIEKAFEKEPSLKDILKTQHDLFLARQNAFFSKKDILGKRIDQLNDEIKGLKAQQDSVTKQREVMETEINMVETLVKTQNAPLTRLMQLQKEKASLDGTFGELNAQIAKAGQMILETKLEVINLENDQKNQILVELQDIEVRVSDLTEQLVSAKDVLKRTVIHSPITGLVMNIQYHTIGAVIQPGADIMNIVPQDDQIVVEAMVRPEDIDMVHAGLLAKVQLTAFKAQKVPKLTAKVLSVSADSLQDEMTGMFYFLARVKLEEDELEKLSSKIALNPGMPAQVFIMTGSRSFMNYLLAPIMDATYKAFRED